MTDLLPLLLAAVAGGVLAWAATRAGRIGPAEARRLHAEAAAATARADAVTASWQQAQGELDEVRRELVIAQRGRAVAETRAEEVDQRGR